MDEILIKTIREIFGSYPEVKLAYLFGSRAEGAWGPMSDYDFAVFLDSTDRGRMWDIRFDLMDRLGRELRSDQIDLVILNLVEGPELKYNIIKYGRILYEEEPYKTLVEPRILNEYIDFKTLLERHGLTRA